MPASVAARPDLSKTIGYLLRPVRNQALAVARRESSAGQPESGSQL
jgi:hypothetical protein